MGAGNKKYYPYYIGLIILIISSVAIFIDNDSFSDVPLIQKNKGIILIIIGVMFALGGFFLFISNYDRKVNKIKKTIFKNLNIPDPETTRNFNNLHLLQAKERLLKKVRQSCKKVLENEVTKKIENTNSLLLTNYYVNTPYQFYENFEELEKNIKPKAGFEQLDIRNNINGLVITGDPGNGKTFNMVKWIYDLTLTIDNDLKKNIDSKIPVFISLNTWDSSELTDALFDDWLIETIIEQYDNLDVNIVRSLVNNYEIIPCLDGLDEVPEMYRFSCFKSILKYAGIRNSMVFSCRKIIFKELLKNITSGTFENVAVFELQTLDNEKIINTIAQTKQNSQDLIAFLLHNQYLFDYINKPLFLNLYIVTFDDLSPGTKLIIQGTKDQFEFEFIMWEAFDNLMMKEKILKGSSDTALIEWTKKVRTYMIAFSEKVTDNVFFIDQVQPQLLSTPFRIFLYYVTSRIISGIIVSMAIGLFVASIFSFIGNGIMASFIIAILTLWLNKEKKIFIARIPAPILFTVVLIIATGAYQGFTVPRQASDMKFYGSFSVTESLSGILVGLFFGAIFGFRKLKQTKEIDIQPVQLFYFNWKHSLITGLKGGVGIGLFIAFAALSINQFLPQNTFYNWFSKTINDNVKTISDHFNFLPQKTSEFLFIFFFAFVVGFVVGFIIFAVLAGLDKEKIAQGIKDSNNELNDDGQSDSKNLLKKEQKPGKRKRITLNYGIKQSLLNSLKYSLLAFVLLSTVYGILIFLSTGREESLIRALMVGSGFGIISFLWFGGFEVIQHWCLRMYLYFYGIMPLQLNRWVKTIIDLAYVRKIGSGLQFYYLDIKEYFKAIPQSEKGSTRIVDVKKNKLIYRFHIIFALVTIILLLLPFYYHNKYWKKGEDIFVDKELNGVKQLAQNKYLIPEECILRIKVTGKIKIGTFAGYIGPQGTKVGLFGFLMKKVYNIDTVNEFNHGALLYRIKRPGDAKEKPDTGWRPLNRNRDFYFSSLIDSCLRVKKDDTLYFILNDNEFENNRGKFKLSLNIFDSTCK